MMVEYSDIMQTETILVKVGGQRIREMKHDGEERIPERREIPRSWTNMMGLQIQSIT